MMTKLSLAVVAVVASVLVGCLGDKDPSKLLLRPPSTGQAPVFASSVDAVPVSTNQQAVYSKNPSLVHSVASASASGGQVGDGRNTKWYDQTVDLSGDSTGFTAYDSPPQAQSASYQVSQDYAPAASHAPSYTPSPGPSYAPQPSQNPSYTYYYQHYPTSQHQGGGGGWSGDDGGSGIFGDLAIPGIGGAGGGGLGLAGAKGLGILALIAKGVLAVKPFLILGLLLLIALPVLFLLLPIPIITITGQQGRTARSSQVTSYLTQLSSKVLNAEECLERVICKMPQASEKYQSKAKLLWDEYGTKVVTHARLARGLQAYFEESSQKNRKLKCEQKFKCSNKFL